MCGIAGVATRGSTPPRGLVGAMCDAMVFQLSRDRFEAGIELPGVHVHAA